MKAVRIVRPLIVVGIAVAVFYLWKQETARRTLRLRMESHALGNCLHRMKYLSNAIDLASAHRGKEFYAIFQTNSASFPASNLLPSIEQILKEEGDHDEMADEPNLFVDVWNRPFYIKIEGNTNHDGGTGNLEPGIAFSIISKGPDKPLDRRFKGDLVYGPFVIWQEGPLFLSRKTGLKTE